jgi:hypothetical protein
VDGAAEQSFARVDVKDDVLGVAARVFEQVGEA